MSDREKLIEAMARAIYEKRNGYGCVAWARIHKDHKTPYLGDARAALSAIEASGFVIVPKGDHHEWQPIESAPKDGTRVLVATASAIHSACYDRIDECWRVLPKKMTVVVPVPGRVIAWRKMLPLPDAAKGDASGL